MKRPVLLALLALLLAGLGVGTWKLSGLPPVHLLWRYGCSYDPKPTGVRLTVEGVEFVELGPGCFHVGSPGRAEGGSRLGRWCHRLGLPWGDQPEPSDETPAHWVEFPHGFWIAGSELTNLQYETHRPRRSRSSSAPGDRDPVVGASWEEAKDYCAWLAMRSGLPIRLPSEVEWECACRGGSRDEFCVGDDGKLVEEYAWSDANSRGRAHEVRTRRPNAYGLHDLHGNVWEWCEDTYHADYEGAPIDGSAWTQGGKLCQDGKPYRVIRGGSFAYGADLCRSAARSWNYQGQGSRDIGFRPSFSIID